MSEDYKRGLEEAYAIAMEHVIAYEKSLKEAKGNLDREEMLRCMSAGAEGITLHLKGELQGIEKDPAELLAQLAEAERLLGQIEKNYLGDVSAELRDLADIYEERSPTIPNSPLVKEIRVRANDIDSYFKKYRKKT